MPVKLEYAYRQYQSNKALVHISEVNSGLACNCICPHCRSNLIAKNKSSNKVAPHFQHYQSQDCNLSVETSLHLLAKEILEQRKQLMLPAFKKHFIVKDKKYRGWGPLYDNEKEILKSELVSVERVELEKPMEDIKPDVIIWVNGDPILIEIYVSHKVDQEKIKKLEKKGIATLEIDLHNLERGITKSYLSEILLSGLRSIWIYHPIIENSIVDIELEIAEKVHEEESRRDYEYSLIEKKRWKKRNKEKYLDKAKAWINAKSSREIANAEEKYNYTLYRRVNENWIDGCPISKTMQISKCLFCEYNPKFNSSSKNKWLANDDLEIGYIQCLHDLMIDRYFSKL